MKLESQATPSDLLEALRRDGLLRHADATLTPFTGGVSSEIYRVNDGDATFVVKRALPKLKVQSDWFADTNRNRYEQLYFKYVGEFLADAVPALLTTDTDRGYFAMEYLGPRYSNWKQLLLAGDCQVAHAALAGRILGTIHRHSAGDPKAARLFDSTSNFHQLRVDPYLLTTGRRHPELRALFEAEAQRLEQTRESLVHGDFSPKNILIADQRMVLLDCEVAWFGDGAFDVAFLLTHFLLKGLYHAPMDPGLRAMADTFWKVYRQEIASALDAAAVETRVARLLLMLLLARVDGKSPVEYLTLESQRNFIRTFVTRGLTTSEFNLRNVIREWFSALSVFESAQ